MAQLISGKAYSLSEIFCGENDKVIIPDLQRDYCWGNPISDNAEDSLASSFIDSILRLEKSQEITMGLIYGYYDKVLTPYHLQLCDGQQRLTTLFLIIGVINRMLPGNKYRDLLISNFELLEDDYEPHLLYGIRESSLYFLSDLTLHYFLKDSLSVNELGDQSWFLNSYHHDPTIASIIRALTTIECKLKDCKNLELLGDFLILKLKFLFYDMDNRQNGEETFVVINTTGEPLTANQNLKPQIMMANPSYSRCTNDSQNGVFNAAQDWEIMETWFWKHRKKNEYDTSTEGMLVFLHCVRILESGDESSWYKNYEISNDKFPLSISMDTIWKWFCAYKRMYETDYVRLFTPKINYPETQSHYTQKELYSILPTMVYCAKYPEASVNNIQRVYHILCNMARYRSVYRSPKNEAINVPGYRMCELIKSLPGEDILGLLELPKFDVEEEISKLTFIKTTAVDEEQRRLIEVLFAEAEDFSIYDGQIQTLVTWSNGCYNRLSELFNAIKELWIIGASRNKLRQALLAYGIDEYPMDTGTANLTLCSKTEWRTLFEQNGESILSFIQTFIEERSLDSIIKNNIDRNSLYNPLIQNIDYLDFAQDHKIRVYAQNVIEVMEKTRANGNYKLFHNGEVFEKTLVKMDSWGGFRIWSDGNVSVFYAKSSMYNITLDMNIENDGYRIIAWLDRAPNKTSVRPSALKDLGFDNVEGVWSLPIIASPKQAKEKFSYITYELDKKMLDS